MTTELVLTHAGAFVLGCLLVLAFWWWDAEGRAAGARERRRQ